MFIVHNVFVWERKARPDLGTFTQFLDRETNGYTVSITNYSLNYEEVNDDEDFCLLPNKMFWQAFILFEKLVYPSELNGKLSGMHNKAPNRLRFACSTWSCYRETAAFHYTNLTWTWIFRINSGQVQVNWSICSKFTPKCSRYLNLTELFQVLVRLG